MRRFCCYQTRLGKLEAKIRTFLVLTKDEVAKLSSSSSFHRNFRHSKGVEQAIKSLLRFQEEASLLAVLG